MNKNRRFVTVFALGLPLLLSACSFSLYNGTDEGTFETKNVNVYRSNTGVDKEIQLRFYSSTPNVPYIGVAQYVKEFFNSDVSKYHLGSYSRFTRSSGAYFAFDTSSDTFTCFAPTVFENHPDYLTSNQVVPIGNASGSVTGLKTYTIDLTSYAIDVYEGKTDVYVPLTLLSDFMGSTGQYNISYNGEGIYIIDYARLTETVRNDAYYPNYHDTYLEKDRPSDLANYAFNELCLNFDKNRGITNHLLLGEDNLRGIGLKTSIERFYPKLKEKLLAPDLDDYRLGLGLLFLLLDDGGHTAVVSAPYSLFASGHVLKEEFKEEIEAEPEFKDIYDRYETRYQENLKKARAVYAKRKEVFSLNETELKRGTYYRFNHASKTAYVGFDSFKLDFAAWDEYYKSKDNNLIPLTTDSYAFIRNCFYMAKDQGVENVILDLSVNGGGTLGALFAIHGLVNKGIATWNDINVVEGTKRDLEMPIDINLDGNYDQSDIDEASKFDFNIAVLTSNYSFSCANAFPFRASESGIKIVGQRSGGGSCSVALASTADGALYCKSSASTIVDKQGNSVDAGKEVDFEIGDFSNPEAYDIDGFFDYTTIADYLSSLE